MSKYYLHAQTMGDLKPALTLGQGFPTSKKMTIGGVEKEVPVAYFWKDAIGTGRYVHPKSKQELSLDEKQADALVANFHAMRAAGIEIPAPLDHSEKAKDNLGFVIDAKRNGDRISLLHQVIGEDAALTALRNRCSLCIDQNYTDERGKVWGPAIVHSAFTPIPVVSGMGEYEPFAASRDQQTVTPIYYLSAGNKGVSEMELKDLREAIGAPADIPDDKLLDKVKELKTTAATALSRATAAESERDAAQAKVTTLSREHKTAPEPDPEMLRDRFEMSRDKIDMAVDKGDMPSFIANKLKEKIGSVEKPSVFMLSRNDAIANRPLDFILGLFDGAKLNPETGVKTGVQKLSRETPGQQDDDESKPVTKERIKELLELSAGGRAILDSDDDK